MAWMVLLSLFELGLRFAGMGPRRRIEVPDRYAKFVPDQELMWTLRPDWDGLEHDGPPVHHNTLGFRGPELAPREEVDLRILYVGDSVTYGQDLREEATLPARVAEVLNARSQGRVEVINAGVPGYSTFQEAGVIRRWGERLAPDLVLLGFCLNDVTERYTTLAAFGGARFFMANVDTAEGLSWPHRMWLASATRNWLVTTMRWSAERGQRYRVEALWEDAESSEVREAWEIALSEMDDAAAAARAAHIPFAVVLYPVANQFAGAPETPQRLLEAHLRAQQIPVMNVMPALRASGLQPTEAFVDMTHFSERGVQATAPAIATFVHEQLDGNGAP